MFSAQQIAGPLLPDIRHRPLSTGEATQLRLGLRKDAGDLAVSAVVSFLDAIKGIERSFFTWSTVKLYYCVFYAVRSYLAVRGVGIVYEGKKALEIDAGVGAIAKGINGTTHACVRTVIQRRYPSSAFLSQQIGGSAPLDWMAARREEANYSIAPFMEPNHGAHFDALSRIGVRKYIAALVHDLTVKNDWTQAFDPDHAIVAYPMVLLAVLGAEFATAALKPTITTATAEFVLGNCRIEKTVAEPLRSLAKTALAGAI